MLEILMTQWNLIQSALFVSNNWLYLNDYFYCLQLNNHGIIIVLQKYIIYEKFGSNHKSNHKYWSSYTSYNHSKYKYDFHM